MKSALAPAFAARALKVRSWSGMNLLGGGDGAALADPARAQSKLDSKGRLLEEILGYPVEAPIHIEDVRDMGEWKTAWDHIVFEGFLGVRMKLQFTWEGCDSALAAPLILDLVRLAALALERGEAGVLRTSRSSSRTRPGPASISCTASTRCWSAGCSRRSLRERSRAGGCGGAGPPAGGVECAGGRAGRRRGVRPGLEPAAHRGAGRRVLVPLPGRDGAQRLRRSRGRRRRAARSPDPVGPRLAGVRARPRRGADGRRRGALGRGGRQARARRHGAAGRRRLGL